MGEQDLDRSEAATPHKLEKARERGQVMRSAEVVGALVFTVAAAALYWKGWDGLQAQFGYARTLLAQTAGLAPGAAPLWALTSGMVGDALAMLAPFLLALVATAILANTVQTGFILSFEPVKPDFSRASPVTGLRKLLSLRTLFDGARAVLKLALLSIVVYQALDSLTPRFFQLAALPPAALARTVTQDIAATALKLAGVLCLIALVDYAYTRREFGKQMRMSQREIRDESRNREGDPRIRARLRQLRREALQRTMALRKASGADVVLTNPTHVAVALRYAQAEMASPQVVAKGAGAQAAAIRKIAARHRIPVVQNPALARALFADVEVEQHVPPALYAQVARILVWVYAMRRPFAGQPTGASA